MTQPELALGGAALIAVLATGGWALVSVKTEKTEKAERDGGRRRKTV